ncbi:probable E3 ubiquitin-protein ligase HERC3 [Astyanax mexicanus]|uniref:probable E3 ubiquitin-protein ligase HERC3 n=1 Tax=Astyanax mexicanus TaxID=7994 RepID=UPI0020CB442A|nr:probable E3 ubiquitin-protein ligase HERC3 [Astyanax mexicanus]
MSQTVPSACGMLCYWGEEVRAGFGLLKPDGVQRSDWGVSCCSPKTRITQITPGGRLLGFVRGEGSVSFIRAPPTGGLQGGRLKKLELKDKIRSMSCGENDAVLLTNEGKVFQLNKYNICSPIKYLADRTVIQIACGDQHCMALTDDGQLFTWGQNSSGQLGLGKKDESSSQSPQPLKSMTGIPLAQISAGGDHSFALSLSGVVFGWGRNNTGQLGLGDREDRYVPVCVKSLNRKKTVLISCGEDHTAVLTKDGLVFTFGSGCYGQLGHNSFSDELRPRLLGGLWGSEVSQIACGRHHTLTLVGSSKTIYSFGCGEQGQLGNGQHTNQCVPLPVQLLHSESCLDQTVERIIAGGNLSVAFCAKQNGEVATADSSPRSSKGISVLDDELIENWIVNCEKAKTWHKVKRKIKMLFSSASSISASFVDKCKDKHYKTSEGHSGLDLSLARCAFEKLAKQQKILLEVESVVERDLLPSLKNTTAAGVEALRVYLILPELLRVLRKIQRGTQLTIDLANSILKLDQESLNLLTNLWTRMPYYYYRTAVRMFHSVAAHFISQMMTDISCWDALKPTLHVLQKLYEVNSQRVTRLTEGFFYIKEINIFFAWLNSIQSYWDLLEYENFLETMENIDIFVSFPSALDLKSKCWLFMELQNREQLGMFGCRNVLCVNRETVLADTLTYLKTEEHDFCFTLQVKFVLEDGHDDGGLCKEYFRLIGQDLAKSSGLIQSNEDSKLFWFSADTSGTTDGFYYLGIICGMAFYNQVHLNIGFPLALFKKLLHLNPTLRDLEELSPVEARNLKNLLTEDEDVVEKFYLDFTLHGKELIPNGQEVLVTKVNRQKYVDLYVDYFFNKSVEYQFTEFAKGFSEGVHVEFWTMFLPEELRLRLYGTCEYKWEELQKITTYEGCGPLDDLIQNFWTVFLELSEEHQKKFLVFMYGSDWLPVGGLSQLRLNIRKRVYENADERFPAAQTCFGNLELPNYSDIDVLRARLVHAITCCETFGVA